MRQIMSHFFLIYFKYMIKYECCTQFLIFQDFPIQAYSTLFWMPKIAVWIREI